jgi:hypothetical protein
MFVVYFIAQSIFQTMERQMINMQSIGNNLKGIGPDLIEVLSQHLSGGTEENYEKR